MALYTLSERVRKFSSSDGVSRTLGLMQSRGSVSMDLWTQVLSHKVPSALSVDDKKEFVRLLGLYKSAMACKAAEFVAVGAFIHGAPVLGYEYPSVRFDYDLDAEKPVGFLVNKVYGVTSRLELVFGKLEFVDETTPFGPCTTRYLKDFNGNSLLLGKDLKGKLSKS